MNSIFEITEQCSGIRFQCPGDHPVLHAMERRGRRCLPVGCRSGGCGLCKVRVLHGEYRCGPMSSRHAPAAARAAGEVLACRLYPLSDLTIESRAPKQPTSF
ncbi:TPA: 2Fe-2S iron-sulfur cluster-binding protein [Pseudomonas aeruginosa]